MWTSQFLTSQFCRKWKPEEEGQECIRMKWYDVDGISSLALCKQVEIKTALHVCRGVHY